MSTLDMSPLAGTLPLGPANGVAGGTSSLRERLAERRRDLQRDRTFELPVPGFADVGIYARYRVLPYETLRRIGENNRKASDTAEGELAIAADTLIHACVELLEKRDDGAFQSLGFVWDETAARELFQVTSLPEGVGSRAAMYEIFTGPAGTTNLMLHFRAYDQQLQEDIPALDEAVRGESAASSAAG